VQERVLSLEMMGREYAAIFTTGVAVKELVSIRRPY